MTVLYCPRNDHLHTHGVRAALYKATHGFCTNLAPPACLCLKTIPYPYGSGFVPNWRAPRATLNPKLSLFHPFSPCHDKDYTPFVLCTMLQPRDVHSGCTRSQTLIDRQKHSSPHKLPPIASDTRYDTRDLRSSQGQRDGKHTTYSSRSLRVCPSSPIAIALV